MVMTWTGLIQEMVSFASFNITFDCELKLWCVIIGMIHK